MGATVAAMPEGLAGPKLSRLQYGVLICLGFSFWGSGVALVRLIAAYGLWNGWACMAWFALSLPAALGSIIGVQRLMGLTRLQTAAGVTVVVAVVVLLHGLGLALAPGLYAATGDALIFAASWLLWFTGVALLVATAITAWR